MITEINKDRGKSLFVNILNKAKTSQNESEIEILKAAFENNVAIIPHENYYGAFKMANACIDMVNAIADSGLFDNTTIPEVIQKYNKLKLENIESSHKNDNNDSAKLAEEITKNYNEACSSEKIVATDNVQIEIEDEDGNVHSVNSDLYSESIDLLNDPFLKKDASIEGKRSLGLISANYNTLSSPDEPDVKIEDNKEGVVYLNKDGTLDKILCPDCYKTNIIPMSAGRYMCADCESEFYTDVEHGYEEKEVSEDGWGLENGIIVRSSGQKKQRGIIKSTETS